MAASESRIAQWTSTVKQTINDSEAFQQLKTKWEELDPQSRTYLKAAAVAGGILVVIIVILSSMWSVHSIKRDYIEKVELLQEINRSAAEIRQLKDTLPGSARAGLDDSDKPATPWTTHFESLAHQSGIDKSSLTFSTERQGASTDLSKELLYDISVKHVNIKQLIRYAAALESSKRPIKIRNMSVETNPDASGYLSASIAVSAFNLVNK